MRGLLSAGAGAGLCEFGRKAGQRLGSRAGGPRQMKDTEGGGVVVAAVEVVVGVLPTD